MRMHDVEVGQEVGSSRSDIRHEPLDLDTNLEAADLRGEYDVPGENITENFGGQYHFLRVVRHETAVKHTEFGQGTELGLGSAGLPGFGQWQGVFPVLSSDLLQSGGDSLDILSKEQKQHRPMGKIIRISIPLHYFVTFLSPRLTPNFRFVN